VSVKARTAEGLGPVGTGKAIEVHAAALMTDEKE
jgi:2C-methyl-D-erythritol 2,4-cyclodiphosphate synthase